jgi:hypothetical protein
LQFALEDAHSTIIKAIQDKGLDFLLAHENIIYLISALESKEYSDAMQIIDEIRNEIEIEDNPALSYYYAICLTKISNLKEACNYCDNVRR